jgi:hypothetical protein
LGATENHDCNCGQWSERLVIQTQSCSERILLSNRPPVNEISYESWATFLKVGGWPGYRAQHPKVRLKETTSWTRTKCLNVERTAPSLQRLEINHIGLAPGDAPEAATYLAG